MNKTGLSTQHPPPLTSLWDLDLAMGLGHSFRKIANYLLTVETLIRCRILASDLHLHCLPFTLLGVSGFGDNSGIIFSYPS